MSRGQTILKTSLLNSFFDNFRASLLPQFFSRPKLTEADLINREAIIGGQLFGAPPAGRQREFFYYKNNIWVWHESWQETLPEGEATRGIVVRYKVRTDGVFKLGHDNKYHLISGVELQNFRRSVQNYYQAVKNQLY